MNAWHLIFYIIIQAIIIGIYLTIDFHQKEKKKRKENIFYVLYSGHNL